MSPRDAKGQLERRMRLRFDGRAMGWSVADAEAVRTLLTHVRDLERKTALKKVAA